MNFRKYLKIGTGSVPIILSCPHGGYLKPESIPDKQAGIKVPDAYKYFITKKIMRLLRKNQVEVYYVLSKIHRSKIDFNRPPNSSSAYSLASTQAYQIFSYYHEMMDVFSVECIKKYGKVMVIDLHGFTKPYDSYPDIIFGNVFGKSLNIKQNSKVKNSIWYWGFSEIIQELSRHFSIDDGLGITDFNISYSGGYITHRFLNKLNINAFQIEVAKFIREDLNRTDLFINSLTSAIIDSLNSNKI